MSTFGIPTVIYLLITSLIGYVLVGSFVQYWKLRQFKGPPLAAFTPLWMVWNSLNGRFTQANFKAIMRYGSVCRIAPNLLITSDPDIIRHMSAPKSQWRRGPWYEAQSFDPRQPTVFSTRDEKLHADLKAKEAGAYSGRDIDSLESDIDVRTGELLSLIREKYDGKIMDLAEVFRYFTLDVLSTIAFGEPFGFMAANEDLWRFGAVAADFYAPHEITGLLPWFRDLLHSQFVQRLAGPKVTDEFGFGPALGFAHRAVAERYGPDPKVKSDMLGHFVKKGLTQLQCEVEAFVQIVAGSDSTTTILRCTIFTIACNPPVYMKLRREIDAAVSAGKISQPMVTLSEAQQLPYLQACLWESWRMYPPLVGLKSKVAPPGGDTIKGIFFPGGTEVADHNEAVCRRSDIFGDDADIYRPERWLEASPETLRTYERTVDTIFGSGKWLCLGRHIAVMELSKAITELMRCFDWSVVDPYKGVPDKMYGLHCQSEMNVVPRSRN